MDENRMNTNSETYFFRDRGQFDLLHQYLLPELIERQSPSKTLRLWSAGCASGEEAYSLAILVDMLLPKRDEWSIRIIGNDVSSIALAKAKQARYGKWSFREMPVELQQHYFSRTDDEWILDERIRTMVSFCSIDLITTPFPNEKLRDFDLILCRNVFIYFEPETMAAVANKFAAALKQNGYLMTAHAELSGVQIPGIQSKLFPASVVYQRVNKILTVPLPATVEIPHATTSPTASLHPLSAPNSVSLTKPNIMTLLTTARSFADRGEYDQAERICHQALSIDPLTAPPYFLLAQVAQLRGDFPHATKMLEKTLYLEPYNAGAILELAALHERANDQTKAHNLRCIALDLIQTLPEDTLVEPYEMTAGEIAQWLTQSKTA